MVCRVGKGASNLLRCSLFFAFYSQLQAVRADADVGCLRTLTRLLYLERDALADSVEESRKGRSSRWGQISTKNRGVGSPYGEWGCCSRRFACAERDYRRNLPPRRWLGE